jgi:hypothetical protein
MADRSVPGPLSALLVTTCAEAVAPPAKTTMSRAGIKTTGIPNNMKRARKQPARGRAASFREGFKSFIFLFSRFKVRFHCVSRKNICVPVRGLVTTFCPAMTIGGVELVCQATGGTRLVANSKVKAVALVG